jgi:predicted phage terminase large subunit-like protein
MGEIRPDTLPEELTADPEAAHLRLLKRKRAIEQARKHLLPFVKLTMPDPEDPDDSDRSLYEPALFHELIAKHLEDLVRGSERQLILCMPPRHGKTELATKKLVPWVLGKHPRWNVAVGSYSDTMAEDFGAAIRETLRSPAYQAIFPQTVMAPGGQAKDRIQIEGGGLTVCVGRGGALTGRGADIAIIDDPFKDFEEARSQAIRDEAWNWFTKVVMTRRMGFKLVLLIMTRWHEDDIVGRITNPDNPHYSHRLAQKWRIINLPAIAEDDDPLEREVGEPLWPEKHSKESMEDQRELDPLGFESMYQQRPTMGGGDLFLRENVQYYDIDRLPDDLRIYAASDHAVGMNARNSKTCLLLAGVSRRDDIYLLPTLFWKRAKSDAVVEAMIDMAATYNPLYWWAENGHISKSIGPFLYKRMQERGVYFNVVEVTPSVDKVQRAQSISARFAMGKVFFPRGAWWTEAAINELVGFGPNALMADFVDALSHIGMQLQSQFGASAAKSGAPPPKYGTLGWVKKSVEDAERAQRRLVANGGWR